LEGLTDGQKTDEEKHICRRFFALPLLPPEKSNMRLETYKTKAPEE
jgi:hypothetical protein